MLGRLADCTETTHQKSDCDLAGCNVCAVDSQLERGAVGAQHQVLAAAGVDEDVLEARQGRDKDTSILNA